MPTDADDELVINFDPKAYNRAQRRRLQDRFGVNFDTLIVYLSRSFFDPMVDPLTVPPLMDAGGNMIAVDDVVIEVILIERERAGHTDSPDAYDEMSLHDLVAAIQRGWAANPKGGKGSKRKRTGKTRSSSSSSEAD